MVHIFKPGDRAYSLRTLRWVELIENNKDARGFYPLKEKDSDETYMQDGRYDKMQGAPCLIPLNPYDLSDPLNPPGFRNEWPFMLRDRKLKVGMEMYGIFDKGTIPVKIKSLELLESDYCTICSWDEGGYQVEKIHPDNLRFPDEYTKKKKITYLWACPYLRGTSTPEVLLHRMTYEEGEKIWGARMIPGSEEEE